MGIYKLLIVGTHNGIVKILTVAAGVDITWQQYYIYWQVLVYGV
jgi:hypothetical protein